MNDEKKWTNFLPDGIERWLRGDKDKDQDKADDAPAAVPGDSAPGVEWRPSPGAAPIGSSTGDPLLRHAAPGVEWHPGAQPSSSGDACPVCGAAYTDSALGRAAFCESCGAQRTDAGAAALPFPALLPDAITQPRRPCSSCGGEVDIEGYCMVCGTKQASERDHYREEPAAWVAGVCDRGIRHARNEDAMALAASQPPGSRAVLVVCDGVSSSTDSDVASLAGAIRARDALWADQLHGVGTPESRTAAMTTALTHAAEQANEAVIENTALDSENAASCTFAAAVVSSDVIFYANLGDSRVYWVPDDGEPRQLSRDDSVAEARIEMGVPRETAESGEGAHAITKWLGRDSTDIVPRVGEIPLADGWIVVCSDGLWNYASTPEQLATVLHDHLAGSPDGLVDVAEGMVAWANEQGGKDNITVALARTGTPVALTDQPARTQAAPSPVTPPPPVAPAAESAATPETNAPEAPAPQEAAAPAEAPVVPAEADLTAAHLDAPTRRREHPAADAAPQWQQPVAPSAAETHQPPVAPPAPGAPTGNVGPTAEREGS